MYLPTQDPRSIPATVYDAGAPPPLGLPALAGEQRADVAVIGGGYTGLSAALHAAEAGARVVLLEANAVGWGASGRNHGQVVPAMKHHPDRVLAVYGPEWGRRVMAAAGDGPDFVFGLIARLGIACAPQRHGIITAAHSPAALRGLEGRARYWQAQGAPVEMLDRERAAAMIGGDLYLGASLDGRGGSLNALAFARGLARAAVAAGAAICEDSRATSLIREGGTWRVRTTGGSLVAETVLLCTNAYTDDLWPGLRQSIVPVRAYQFSTAVLPDHLRRTILPGGQAMTDTRRLLSAIRVHPDGRLHVSGAGAPFGPQGAPDFHRAERRLAMLYPGLGAIAWQHGWSCWFAMTPDHFPRLHELAPGLFTALGYSGRGIVMSTTLGREMSRRAAGVAASELAFPVSEMRGLAVHPVHRPLVRALIAWYRLRDGLEMAALRRAASVRKARGAGPIEEATPS
jgi:glycine/D-amino acid oxidase-like deaminating enzyme